MTEKPEKKVQKIKGAALIELALVILIYTVITLGGIEFMWYLHIKDSLSAAAEEAVKTVAVDHDQLPYGNLSTSSASLDPLRALADQTARNYLLNMGFSSSFVSSVGVNVDYLNQLNASYPSLPQGGFPQSKGRRLVGAAVTVPWENAMIFGNIATNLLSLVSDTPPTELTVIAFMWKQWKQES